MLEAMVAPDGGSAASGDKKEKASMRETLALPTVPAQYLHSLNAFYRRRPSLQLKFAGRGIRLAPTWLADEPDIANAYTITLKVDGDQAELVVSQTLLALLLQELDPALSLDVLGPEQTALVTEYALSDALATLEQAVGCQISVIAVSKGAGTWTGPDRPALPLVLYIERMGIAWAVLRLSAGDIVRLAYFLDKGGKLNRDTVDVPVPFRVRVASVVLTLEEIRSVEPGDILLPDDMIHKPDAAVAVIGEHLVTPVEISAGGCRIGARIRRGRGSSWEWSLNQQSPAQTGAESGGVDALDVRVMFEAGSLDLDMSEIQRLAPGSILPLPRPPDEGLDIVVNGQRIGRGKLAKIGESTGVRVTRLFGKP